MCLLDDVWLVESEIFAPPIVSMYVQALEHMAATAILEKLRFIGH